MTWLRLAGALVSIGTTQVGLWLALCRIYSLRPRARRWLAVGQVLLLIFFVAFLFAARAGAEVPPLLRIFVVEPLLVLEAFTLPLLLVLGTALSIAGRAPPRQEPLSEARRVFLARAATGLFAGAAGFVAFGIDEAEEAPELTRRDVFIRGLPRALDGLTVLQLSDIHAGALMTQARMEVIARAGIALAPDLVVMTGDLFDVSARAAAPFTRAFRDLHGKLGTFAILGNHDYLAGEGAVKRAVQDAGMRLLRNDGARIERGGGTLWLGGVDDPSKRSVGSDPVAALRHASPEEPRILLAHRPSLFDECASAGAQLVLSGHTHGGQIALSPRWSFARALGPYTMGHYEKNGAQLYVHRGMGTVGPVPLRAGSPPELALLTLRRS